MKKPRAELPESLSPDELERYRRHLVLPEVGPAGQLRLKRARVLLVGAGGLGSPAGLYLAAAGVGRLTLVDDDAVDTTNLQRQVIFGMADVGRPKVDAAGDRLRSLNPRVEIVVHRARLTADNAAGLIRGHDIVVDGTDNFAAHYLVNDACVQLGVPHVHGSILRFEGQVSLFGAAGGPCYRCLYPAPPGPDAAPDCAEAGVIGALPGIVGAIQAAETIKWILQAGATLRGRLLRIDALRMNFSELAVERDPACPACGHQPTVPGLDNGSTRRATRKEAPSVAVPEMTVKELKRRLDAGEDIVVLDVREPHEYDAGHISDLHIPLGELPARMHELDSSHETVVYCRSGNRSARAAEFLQASGFDRVSNLKGGIRAWADEIDPRMPK